MHDVLYHASLARQFELRRKAWRPNMDIKETPPYLVDGVLDGSYVPPNAENEHEMQCFDLSAWQQVVHDNESDCTTP